jgi:hypothetical protein
MSLVPFHLFSFNTHFKSEKKKNKKKAHNQPFLSPKYKGSQTTSKPNLLHTL